MPITKTPLNLCINAGNVTWTNQPLAVTELFGNVHRRAKKDLTDVHKVRLVARISTVGAAAGNLRAQYSTDESAWTNIGSNTLPLTPVGTHTTVWEDLPEAARGDVFLRVVGVGDNTADPVIGNVYLEFI